MNKTLKWISFAFLVVFVLLTKTLAQTNTNAFQTNIVLNVSISMTAYIQEVTLPALPTASIQHLATRDIIAAIGSDIGSGANIFPPTATLLLKYSFGGTNEGGHFVVRAGPDDFDVTAPTLRLALSVLTNANEVMSWRPLAGGKTNATDYSLNDLQLNTSRISFDVQGLLTSALSSLVDRGRIISGEPFQNSFGASFAGSGLANGKPALFQGVVRSAGRKIEITQIPSQPPPPSYPGTFTYHNDNFRTGQNLQETSLTPTNVNSATFGKLFSYPLDGLSLASPLYVANVLVPGKGVHNLVYVATEHDSVYAFDADGLTNAPLWKASFINPAAGVTTVPPADTGESGDIPSEIGISSTPVIDPASGTLYVVSKVKKGSGGTASYEQRLHALSIATGGEKLGGPVVIHATSPVPFDPLRENQRSALLLANGVVYLAFASHGDNETYYGWLFGYDATTLQQTFAYNTAPDATKSGVWMSGSGPAADSAGNVYLITGNGAFNVNIGGRDYGDTFQKFSPAGAVLDYFTPKNQSILDSWDLDQGASGLLLLPTQSGPHPHEAVNASKSGTIYLLDRDSMGHYDPSTDNCVQTVESIFVNATGIEGGNFTSPVYFNGFIFFGPVADNIQAFQLSNGLLSTNATSRSSQTYYGRGATMAISANDNTNGILWSLQSQGAGSPGVLHAYDAMNLSNELYNSAQAGLRDTLDTWIKFTIPLVANGKVFVASASRLTAYGLLQ